MATDWVRYGWSKNPPSKRPVLFVHARPQLDSWVNIASAPALVDHPSRFGNPWVR